MKSLSAGFFLFSFDQHQMKPYPGNGATTFTAMTLTIMTLSMSRFIRLRVGKLVADGCILRVTFYRKAHLKVIQNILRGQS